MRQPWSRGPSRELAADLGADLLDGEVKVVQIARSASRPCLSPAGRAPASLRVDRRVHEGRSSGSRTRAVVPVSTSRRRGREIVVLAAWGEVARGGGWRPWLYRRNGPVRTMAWAPVETLHRPCGSRSATRFGTEALSRRGLEIGGADESITEFEGPRRLTLRAGRARVLLPAAGRRCPLVNVRDR